jgi:hypothetical protein
MLHQYTYIYRKTVFRLLEMAAESINGIKLVVK